MSQTPSTAQPTALAAAQATITPISVNVYALDLQPIMDVLPAGELYRLFALFTTCGRRTIGEAIEMIESDVVSERDLLLMATVREGGYMMPPLIRTAAAAHLGISLA